MKNPTCNSLVAALFAACLFFLANVRAEEATGSAEERTSGDWTYKLGDSKEAVIVGYNGPGGEVAIPATLDGNRVKQTRPIDAKSSVTSVRIPDSLTDISGSAFSEWKDLKDIIVDPENPSYASVGGVLFDKTAKTLVAYPSGRQGAYAIPAGVTGIGDCAFCGCANLASVSIPGSVTSIGALAFYECTSLTGVTIPDGVKSIGELAFTGCSGLKDIIVDPENPSYASVGGVLFDMTAKTLIAYPEGRQGACAIPAGVTSIGDSAFEGCKGLTKVTLPDGLKSIGDSAFAMCSPTKSELDMDDPSQVGLANITIPDSVTSIGDAAFVACYKLTNAVISRNLTSISGSMFESCYSLGNVTIPDGVKSIGERAFRRCLTLTNVTIPDSVTSIGGFAFQQCQNLPAVNIPARVESIGEGAFLGCWGLEEINVDPGNSSYASVGGVLFDKAVKTLLRFPTARQGAYEVPAGVTGIAEDAFGRCQLTSVTIPDSVTSIEQEAFDGCTSLTTASIPHGLAVSEGVFPEATRIERRPEKKDP